jgi:hypothetical protein
MSENPDTATIAGETAPVLHSRLYFDGPKAPLFMALAEARKHFGSLSASSTADVKMKSGGSYKFSYAPLDVVLEALAPGLAAGNLALMQPFDGDVMYTIVACEGSSMTVETVLPAWSDPQDLGSLLTYIRRYQLKGLFCLADQEDDDGNAASGNKATVTRKSEPPPPPVRKPDARKEPTAPARQASGITEQTKKELYATAKQQEMSHPDFLARANEVCGKPFVEFTELDAKKFLAALVMKAA